LDNSSHFEIILSESGILLSKILRQNKSSGLHGGHNINVLSNDYAALPASGSPKRQNGKIIVNPYGRKR